VRGKHLLAAVAALVVVGGGAARLIKLESSSQGRAGRADAPAPSPAAAAAGQPQGRDGSIDNASADAELAERLKSLCERAGGSVGVAVTHVETGRSAEVEGAKQLPLYSVFKLPLAVAVLKDVEEGRLRLEQKVRVTPAEIAPGLRANTELWREPVERTIAELVELSIVRSDNTSTDKLLQLVGGPGVVTRRMRALGLDRIEIKSSVREFLSRPESHNTGAASDIARLLALLRRGEVLQPPQLSLLLGYMGRTTNSSRRLRGDLPAGTPVADKTGTGGAGAATHDVGLITLPEGKGHLAVAVLVSGSKLSEAEQEKLIARLARAAYDAHVPPPAQGK
jgi:beta-lactamase class A